MINLIVTVFGVLMIVAGFYLMYLGFSTPPNPLAFFLGLILSVLGLICVILYGSRIGSAPMKPSPKKSIKQAPVKKVKPQPDNIIKPKPIKPKPKTESKPKEKAKKPTPVKRPQPKPVKPKPKSESGLRPIKPRPQSDNNKPQIKFGPKIKAQKPPEIAEKVEPIKPEPKIEKSSESKPKPKPKPDIMVQKEKGKKKPVEIEEKPKKIKTPVEKPKKAPKSKEESEDDKYVKNRLEKLKANYFQNTKEIENIIDERLDSFKGTLNSLKSESTEPSIIWSFEAKDVQGAMKDTISKAKKKVLMMYPWVRNIDVSILKKFMDTNSKMIIQEASLDDDASVELIRLLMENNVQIRTMPHVHTVALVSDDKDGLIISTDPIYESYEVGVIYKDKKSVKEIEKMFDDAWNISKDINMEIET